MGFVRAVRTGRTAVAAAVAWGSLTAWVPATSAAPAPAAAYAVLFQPEDGQEPVYRLIDSATRSIALTTYQLSDRTTVEKLVARQQAGARVRVILDQRNQPVNAPAYQALKDGGVDVVWSDPRYYCTHQKTLVIDGTTALIMTGNLTSQRYAAYRDYGVVDTDPADVTAIEEAFTADHTHTPAVPGRGRHLVWSPADARRQLLTLIGRATKSLSVECLSMSDAEVTDALAAAARRHVKVTVVMTNTKDTYAKAFDTLTDAGARVSTYTPSERPYIHAKAIVADHTTPHEQVFIGSENFTPTSLDKNRELGVILPDKKVADRVASVIDRDYAGATPWMKTSSEALTTLGTAVNQILAPRPRETLTAHRTTANRHKPPHSPQTRDVPRPQSSRKGPHMYRHPRQQAIASRLLAACALTGSLLLAAPCAAAPAAAADRSVRERADHLMSLTYREFTAHAQHREQPFDWDTDGCSPPTPAAWAKTFHEACTMHDFGYHNYGNHGTTKLRLDPTEARRTAIDHRFLQEMQRTCDDHPDALPNCRSAAQTMFGAVRAYAGPAFH